MSALRILLVIMAVYQGLGLVGSELRALKAQPNDHEHSLRNSIYGVGFTLAIGLLLLTRGEA